MIRRVGAAGLGVFIGLAALEALVRPFASVQLPPPPDIPHDMLAGPLIESRQIEEGIQTSHYTSGGSRWTGAQPVADAPVIVIIGDSYVVAREVADAETMGAWVERLARNANVALNARQYGWRAARPAQYVLVSRAVKIRWSPARVIVVLSDNDFDAQALTDTMLPPPTRRGMLERSSLVMLVRHRKVLLDVRAQRWLGRWRRRFHLDPIGQTNPAPVTGAPAETPATANPAAVTAPPADRADAIVEALARSYGSALGIVYVANTRVPDGGDATESGLLAACASQRVQCVSTRSAMHALERRGAITRGFSTTTLGSGHLNATGHEMLGRLIWSMVRLPSAR